MIISAPATIANGQSTSNWIDRNTLPKYREGAVDYILAKLVCPAGLSTITSISFEETYDDGVTAKPVYDEYGTLISIPVAYDRSVRLPVDVMAVLAPKFRIKANANASAERIFTLGFRPV